MEKKVEELTWLDLNTPAMREKIYLALDKYAHGLREGDYNEAIYGLEVINACFSSIQSRVKKELAKLKRKRRSER